MDHATNPKTSTLDDTRTDRVNRNDGNAGAPDFAKFGRNTTEELGAKAADPAETIGDRARDAGEAIMDGGHRLMDQSRTAHHTVCEFTTRNPTAALLIALGVGAFVARLLPRG